MYGGKYTKKEEKTNKNEFLDHHKQLYNWVNKEYDPKGLVQEEPVLYPDLNANILRIDLTTDQNSGPAI